MQRRSAFTVLATAATAALQLHCSAPATLRELQAGEQAERSGHHDVALQQYRAAQQTCRSLTPKRRRDIACAQATLNEAELLDQDGDRAAAIIAYRKIAESAAAASLDDPSAFPPPGESDAGLWARAGYRLGALLLETKDAAAAYTAWWRVVTALPNEPTAGDALTALVRDARVRNAGELASHLADLLTPLAETAIADNLLWWLADLAEHERNDATLARSYYDRIYQDHPQSGMRDDSRWHAARLSRGLGDAAGAAQRLRGLLATREVAVGTGSYFSVWLDNAQLELGRVLRDDLHQPAAAADAFAQLLKDYPASILRDDALFELAVTQSTVADAATQRRGCAAWARLQHDFPDSKYLQRKSEVPACQK